MTPDDLLFARGLPASIDAEKTVLGAILLDNGAYYNAELLAADDFFFDSHQRLFMAIARLMEDNRAVDIVTLANDLSARNEVQSIGGVAYIASLTEGLPRRLAIGEYVRIIRDCAKRRRIISACSLTISKALEQELDPDELIADQDKRLLAISSGDSEAISLATMCAQHYPILFEEMKGKKPPNCIPTGFDELDQHIGGWRKDELSIIAARSSRGKSSLLIQTLIQCGRNNVPAVCYQLEMTAEQMLRRILSAITGIPSIKFRLPYLLSERDVRLIQTAQEEMLHWPLKFEYPRSLTAAQLVAKARAAKRRDGVELIGLDYLQKLEFTSDKPEARYIVVGDAARALASLARDERIAVLAVSSLTDKSGRSEDARPSMSDIRQSGDVMYEAGCIVLLHRQEIVQNEVIEWSGCMIVEKQRQGEVHPGIPVNYSRTCQFESTNPKPQSDAQRDLPYAVSQEKPS